MSATTMQQQLPSKMRGLVIEKFAESVEQEKRPYTMREDLPLPKLQPHQILLKVTTSGYCHTEHMVARGEFKHMMRQDLPLIPSHEPTGIVVALGSDAEKMSEGVAGFSGSPGPGKVRTGDRVGAIAFSNFCGKCDDCKAGNLKFCSDQDFVGVTFNGGFAEYCAVDVRSCVRLPDALSFDAAAPLMCAGATIFTAIKACNLKAGQSLGIVGAGSLGHLGVQFSKAMGYRTVIVDARDPPLEMCKGLPYAPDASFNNSETDPSDQKSMDAAISACGGPLDAIIVSTDVISAFTFSFNLAKKHGLVIVVGQPQDPIPVTFWDLIFKDLTIKGSLLASPEEAKEMVDLVAAKGIECRTRAYDLNSVHDMMADYGKASHAGKLVVRVSEGESEG